MAGILVRVVLDWILEMMRVQARDDSSGEDVRRLLRSQLELDEDVTTLRKPFSALDLARTIRTTLDARRTPFQVARG